MHLSSSAIGFPGGSDSKASACSVGDPGSIPGSGRSPGEENGNPLPWRIPWTEEPIGLQFMGSQESDSATNPFTLSPLTQPARAPQPLPQPFSSLTLTHRGRQLFKVPSWLSLTQLCCSPWQSPLGLTTQCLQPMFLLNSSPVCPTTNYSSPGPNLKEN